MASETHMRYENVDIQGHRLYKQPGNTDKDLNINVAVVPSVGIVEKHS